MYLDDERKKLSLEVMLFRIVMIIIGALMVATVVALLLGR